MINIPDMWIQNDTLLDNSSDNICAGFLYVQSNDKTRKYFNTEISEFEQRYTECKKQNNDQTYINLYIKPFLNIRMFPLYMFPNGQYFFKHHRFIADSIVMVHYNWIIGENKKEQMKKYNMWLI